MKDFIEIETTEWRKVLIAISEIKTVRSMRHSGCLISLRDEEIETHASFAAIQAKIQLATSRGAEDVV
jgi:hypothetical protein